MDLNKLCPGCMEDDSGDPICPKCGRPADLMPKNSLQMKPRTMLRDQYMIGRALGHGGFGITYLAWDVGLEARLAIKEYMPNGVAGRAANDTKVLAFSDQTKVEFDYGLDRFLEEARVLKKFRDHPNIVSIDTIFRDNGTAYLVMEYLDGMTFEEFLKRRGGKITLETALRVLLPVMDALAAVHAEGILHRDISPDNIHLARNGKVKLIDFGAARNALGQKSRNLSIILKEGYAPEEQYRASGIQGPWTDVYATAATLYHAITGQVPQPSLDRQAEDLVRRPSEMGVVIDPVAEAALMNALAVKAADRFKSMEDFKAALGGGPLSAGNAQGNAQAEASTAATRKVDRNDPRIRELEQSALQQASVRQATGMPGPPPPPGGPPPPPLGAGPPFPPPPGAPMGGPMGAPMAAQMIRPALRQPGIPRWMWPAALGAVAVLAIVVVMMRTPTPAPDDNKDKNKDKTGVVDGGGNGGGNGNGGGTGGGGQGGNSSPGGGTQNGGGDNGGGTAGKGAGDGPGTSGGGTGGGGTGGGGTGAGGGAGANKGSSDGGSGNGNTAKNGGGQGGSKGRGVEGGNKDNGGGANNGAADNKDGGGGARGDGGTPFGRTDGGNSGGGTNNAGNGGGGTSDGGRGRGGEPTAGGDTYDGLVQAAIKAAQQNGFPQAAQFLNRAVAMEPNNPKAYDKLGELDLYSLNQIGPALQNYQASIAHGGVATFHVAHDHSTGNFTTNCKGWLYVSKSQVRYQAFDSIHAFTVPRAQIREFKRNRFTVNLGNRAAVDLKAFHIKLADGKNYNFAPTSHFAEAERDLILSIGGVE